MSVSDRPAPALKSAERRMPVTLTELGRRLNLSARAVSEVLNGGNPTSTVRVNPKTRERVRKLADKLGYRANRSAQTLRLGKRRGLLGILLHSGLEPVWQEKAYYAHCHAEQNGFQLIPVYPRSHDHQGGMAAVDFFLDYRVEAVVMLQRLPDEGVQALLEQGIQVLSIGAAKPEGVPGYFPDKEGAARMLTRHLLDGGNRRILLVGGVQQQTPTHSIPIIKGFEDAIARARLHDPEVAGEIFSSEIALEGFMARDFPGIHGLFAPGYAALKEKLATVSIPDAVFGMIPSVAQGAIGALTEAGVAVPERVAVAGFGDDPWSCTGKLPLTGVRFPNDELCARAFADLRQVLAGEAEFPGEDVYLPCELLVRDSSRAKKHTP